MHDDVAAFVAERWAVTPHSLQVDLEPLRGGLESTVARARLRTCVPCPTLPAELVVKHLSDHDTREAEVYELLWSRVAAPPTARMLGRQQVGTGTHLYLEHVASASEWPWTDTAHAALVCRALARLHDAADLPPEPFAWDYEGPLAASAAETLRLATAVRDPAGLPVWRRRGDLARVVRGLPAMRAALRASGTTVLHGDVHPGNVAVVAEAGAPRVALIDWGRARIGSPFEDIACWLHSLGCWEPEARRRHDTLLGIYLASREVPIGLTPEVRRRYWMASASNGLSGAIAYHLAVRGDVRSTPAMQFDAWRALQAWERVIRRAASLLSTTGTR